MADYNEIAKRLRAEQDQSVGTALYNAADVNADKEGFLTQLSKRTGIPVTSLRVKDLEQDAIRLDVANKYDSIVKNSPNLANWLSTDQQNANLAHDDTENLGLIDTLVNSFQRGMIGLTALPDRLQLANQAAGLQQLDYVDKALARGETPDPAQLGVLGTMYAQADEAGRRLMREQYAPPMQKRLAEAATGIAETQRDIAAIPQPAVVSRVSEAKTFGEALSAFGEDPFKFIAAVGPESLAQSAPGLAAAVPAGIAAGPLGAGVAMGASSAMTEYANSLVSALQEAGVNVQDPEAVKAAVSDPEFLAKAVRQAGIRAGVVGTFDALSGGIAGKALLPAKTLAGKPFARELANIGLQIPVQGAMGAAGEATASLAAGQEIKPGDVLGEFVGEAFGAPVDVVTASAKRLTEQLRSAARTEQNTRALQELDKLAAASKVRQRDTDTFENFVAQASEEAPLQDVYIDAKALMQSGVAAEVAAVSPSVAEQLPAAAATGGTIRIPVAEYAARIAGTELNQPLIENLRTEPDGFSQNEAREFLQSYQEDLKREVEQALGARQADDTFRASAKAVEDRVFAELEAAGRFKTDVNRAYATLQSAFASTMASKLGVTPEQFFEKNLLRVVAERTGGQQLDQTVGAGSRIGLSFKDVIKRTPELQAAAQKVKAGEMTAEEYDALVAQYKPVEPYTEVPAPASTEDIQRALTSDKLERIGAPSSTLEEGHPVGLRLDIPAYANHGVWVVSVHEQEGGYNAGKSIGYESVAAATDVTFGVVEKAALNIAGGKPKATIAVMKGGWKPTTPAEAKATADAALNDPAWVQVGMDPERHAYFYDRATMEPVVAADEVIQIGPLVLAKNPQYAAKGNFLFQSLTTMVPKRKGVTVDPALVKVPGINEAEADDPKAKAALENNVNLFDRKVQTVSDKQLRGYDSINPQGDTPKERAESIIDQMVRNLLTIHDAIPEAIRNRSRLWYDGANRISLAFAQRYGLTPMQSAAQLAVLSPQADWFMNVSYAERINDILEYQQDHTWDADMDAWADSFIKGKEGDRQKEAARRAQAVKDAQADVRSAERAKAKAESALEKNTPKLEAKIAEAEQAFKDAEQEVKAAKKDGTPATLKRAEKQRDKRNDELKAAREALRTAKSAVSKADTAIRQANRTLQEKTDYAAEPDENMSVQPFIRGKKLSELDTDFERAWWVRAYDEAHHPRSYRVVTPEGGFLDFAKTDDGNANNSIGWKSFSPISKAIAIRRDGSVENVHNMLGNEHKVRNFYNNIYDPNAPQPFVTSDTHQVAANLFLPLGSAALEVAQNFGGTGTKPVTEFGLYGTYWLYSEAVARAAKERGVLPREMQSISWEAIRSLFKPSFKSNDSSVNAVRDLWVRHHAGEASYADTVNAIIELAGGYSDPSWVGIRPDSAAAPEAGQASYESELSHARQGLAERGQPGPGNEGVPGRELSAGSEQAGGGVLNQSAFHGSPYLFDQFTLDHIGTGEGAQAFGWGLYFAGNRQVAEWYRKTLSQNSKVQVSLDGKPFSEVEWLQNIGIDINDITNVIASPVPPGMDANGIINDRIGRLAYRNSGNTKGQLALYRLQNEYNAGNVKAEKSKGQLYEVDIPEDADMLLFDKPITSQPDAVKKILKDSGLWKELKDNLSNYASPMNTRGKLNGENIYAYLEWKLGSPEAASKRLNELGIPGLKYPSGTIAGVKSAGYNYVIFDDKAIQILNTFYQQQQQVNQPARGSFNPETNTIALLKAADLSTFLHESGHFFLETQFSVAANLMAEGRMFGQDPNQPGAQQILDDTNAILKWFGINSLDEWFTLDFEEQRAYHEKFAESFEAYLFDGKAPSIELQGAFQRFRSWLVAVYKSLKDFITRNPAAGELNNEIRQVMDRMLATDEQIALAEQARSMMPLFTSPEQAGMTVDEFAAYQALGRQATADAQDELQRKSLRDLQWYANAKQREIRKLKRLSAQRRSEVRMDARREIMSQPIYQAWQFLTNKLTADDKITPKVPPKADPNRVQPEMDSLFTAIAKLGGINRAEVEETWGWDERVPVPVFGKPLLRREGGKSIDGMAEALGELGYLTLDKNGKADIAELEEKFDDERRGTLRYSTDVDPALIVSDERRAGEGINTDALGAGRFDAAELRGMGIPAQITDLIVGLKMTGKNGLHPDIVAERFGFSSGDELVRTLAFAETPKVAIEALTDAKMLEQYGELSSEEAIAREADKAIHNDLRARMLTTEANALAKAAGQRKVLAPAAKEFAAAMIARLRVREVKPGQYTAAEARAGKAAEKASRTGKLAEAAAEKRNQLVNNYAAKAAYQALDDVERGVRYLKKFDREATRQALSSDYMEQIDALLERFDLRKQSLKAIDKRASLAAWIESQRAMGLEPNIPEDIANEAMRKSYKDMTVEEFRGLIDTVRQIEHLGRLKERLLTAKDLREFKAVRDLIANSIKDNAGNREAVTREARTTMERVQQTARRFGWAHIKANTIARILDGGKDAGPVWEYFIRSANERGDFEVEKRAKATEDITRILEPVFKLGNMGGKGQFFPSIGQSLNREARIALALNTGNEGNLQRLLGGEGWTMQQIQPVLQSLTAAEWQTVQNIWDYFESYRPEIAAKEKRVYGKEPNWVEPKGFTITTADGQRVELKGGYYPIKYDPNASQRAEEHADADAAKRQLQGAYTSATTRRSFTKARAEEVSGRPLLLSLEGVYSGLNEVIHDLAWHEWLIDANRLLRSETIDSAIRQHYGPEVKAQLKNWVKDVAEGDRPAANAAESALSRLRQGVSAAGLGFNVMNAMMQVTGFIPAGVRIGWEWVGKGAARYIGGPIAATTQANELSSFMKNRSRTRLRELAEVRNRVQDANQTFTKVNELAYFMMLRTQQVVDTVTWWGAFEKALAAGNTEERAIGLADQAVLDSQGGGQLKDLSAVERGGPALKIFTVYYSYMNTMLNLGTAEQMTNKQRGKRLANQLLIFTVAPMLGLAIKEGLTPGGDDEWDWGALAKKMAAEQLAFLMGLMVVVREFSEAGKMVAGVAEYSRDYGGPAGLRAISEVNKLATQVNQGEVDDAFVRASVNTVGALTGLPAAQINRTIAGAEALAEDKTDNPAALVLGFQK